MLKLNLFCCDINVWSDALKPLVSCTLVAISEVETSQNSWNKKLKSERVIIFQPTNVCPDLYSHLILEKPDKIVAPLGTSVSFMSAHESCFTQINDHSGELMTADEFVSYSFTSG